MGQLISLLVQLAIGQLPVPPNHSNGFRRLLRLGLEQLMDTLVLGKIGRGSIPLDQHLLALGGCQEREVREALLGMSDDAL